MELGIRPQFAVPSRYPGSQACPEGPFFGAHPCQGAIHPACRGFASVPGFDVSRAAVGLDFNRSGQADLYVMGSDASQDGIPDALQRGGVVFAGAGGVTPPPPSLCGNSVPSRAAGYPARGGNRCAVVPPGALEQPLAEGEVLMVVPEGAQPGSKLHYAAPDGQELLLTVPDGVPPGSIMILMQDPQTGQWRCLADPSDMEEPQSRRQSAEMVPQVRLAPGPVIDPLSSSCPHGQVRGPVNDPLLRSCPHGQDPLSRSCPHGQLHSQLFNQRPPPFTALPPHMQAAGPRQQWPRPPASWMPPTAGERGGPPQWPMEAAGHLPFRPRPQGLAHGPPGFVGSFGSASVPGLAHGPPGFSGSFGSLMRPQGLAHGPPGFSGSFGSVSGMRQPFM